MDEILSIRGMNCHSMVEISTMLRKMGVWYSKTHVPESKQKKSSTGSEKINSDTGIKYEIRKQQAAISSIKIFK